MGLFILRSYVGDDGPEYSIRICLLYEILAEPPRSFDGILHAIQHACDTLALPSRGPA